MIEVTKREVDLTNGFGHIVFNKNGKEYTLKACLMLNKRYHDPKTECVYTKRINESDSGFNENEKAINDIFGGYQEAFNFFKKELKKIGVKFTKFTTGDTKMKTVKIALFNAPIEGFPQNQRLQLWNDDHSESINELEHMKGKGWKRITEWVEVELPLLEG